MVTLDFGGNAIFDKPIKITIPVNGITSTSIQADHGNGPTTDGLTTDPHAICSNGIADPSYNKNLITTIDDTVTIYSCAASKFIAYTQEDSPSNP